MIIGLTGSLSAGKGTVANFLKEKGFENYSARDFLVDEINKRGLPVTNDIIASVENQLREINHPAYIVEVLYEKAKLVGGDCAIESLKTSLEVEFLRKKGDFILIAIDAEPQRRYERTLMRGGETDKITFDKFLESEQKENFSEDENKQNLKECIKMADFILTNNRTINDLKKSFEEVFEKINYKKYKRPSWDEYFMEVTRTVAKRSTCDRGRSGCVIAKNRQILVTGYAGSPVGFPHCDEVGHQMKKTIHEGGSVSQHCVRTVHAEQNAICQAAKLGISINEATLYCKMNPCQACAKIIINSGIKRVVCEKKDYMSEDDLFKKAGIPVDVLNNEVERYENQ